MLYALMFMLRLLTKVSGTKPKELTVSLTVIIIVVVVSISCQYIAFFSSSKGFIHQTHT